MVFNIILTRILKKMKTKITLIPILILLLFSCGSTNHMTIRVTKPAPVYIPSDINSVGIINRSLPSQNNKTLDDIDKILSAEGKDLDKDAAKTAVVGLYDELTANNAFSEVKLIEDLDVRSPGLGVFPAAIPWKQIEEICNENNVDAIFALSFYDTDSKISYKIDTVRIANPLGIKIPALEHRATISTNIHTGWRIYDPLNKIILDEYLMPNGVKVVGKGINPIKALNAIAGRKEAVLSISNKIGHNYALRIFPYRIRVSRDYYVKGTNNFEIAMRRAQAGDWDGAAELWEKEVNNPDSKIAGRACYNMAIINEINGNLEKAVEWATKSYTDYDDKIALKYVRILKYRIDQNRLLEEQNRE